MKTDIKWALLEMAAGAKVRRKAWKNKDFYLHYNPSIVNQYGHWYRLDESDVAVEDWEHYCKL